jgi:hypothetical protein
MGVYPAAQFGKNMAQYLPLPDGNSVTIREGETPQQAYARAQQMYPESFAKAPAPGEGPESGFTPSLKAGYSGLKSGLAALAGKTGIMDEAAAAKYMQEQEEYQKKTFKPTETFGEAPLTKTAELFGGSLPYMAAPIVAGGLAASAPVSGALGLGALGASVLGGTAAGLASTAQFTGSNLQRQVDTGKTLQQAELGSAVMAAIPQAALDVVSLKMLPGIRNILSAGGKEVSGAVAKKFAEQGLKEVAKDYAAATGKAMGTEALTEAAQQVLERAQAGLNLTDEKAREEYWDSMVGGAVLGGVLSPAGRYVERRGEAKVAEGDKFKEAQEARVEEEKRRTAEAAERSTPEYARKVVADYQAIEKQRADLKAQLRTVKEGSPTESADLEFNKSIQQQRKKITKEAEALGQEYNRVLPLIAKEKEAARLAGMTPEEYMLETMPQPAAATRTREQRLAALNAAPQEEEAAPGPEAKYAEDRVTLAREQQPAADAKDYVDYLMADPAMARVVAQNRTPLPGLTANEQSAVHGALRLQFKAEDAAAAKAEATATKAEMTQRTEDLKAQKITEEKDPLAMLKASMAGEEEIRTTGEANFDYLDPIFEKALEGQPPVVAVNPAIKPSRDAKRVKTNIDTLTKAIDTAEQDYITAKRAGESTAASEAFGRGNQAIEQLQQFEKDEASGPYAQSILRLRNEQQAALNSVEESLDRIRKDEVLGKDTMASNTQAGLVTRAEKARADFIKAVLQEAATHRRANNQPAMTTDEATKAASELHDTFNEWIKRVQNEPKRDTYEPVLVEPAQMRANKLVREARYEQRKIFDSRPIEGYRFGAYPQAVQVLKDQLDQIRDNLGQVESRAEKVEPLLKTQFATTEAEKTAEARGEKTTTLSGELRRRSEYVGNMLEKAFTRSLPEELRETLEQAQDVITRGKATRDLLDAVEVQAGRILRGEDMGTKIVSQRKVIAEGRPVYEVTPDGTMRQGTRGRRTADVGKTVEQAPASEYMQDIKDALAAISQQEQGGETVGKVEGQKELFAPSKQFGMIRATPESFERSPMVQKARAAMARVAEALKLSQRYANAVKQRSEAIALFNKQIDDAQSGMEGTKWLSIAYPKVGTSVTKWEPHVPTKEEIKADPTAKTKYNAAKAVADRYNAWVDATNKENELLKQEGAKATANAKAIAAQLVEMKSGLVSAIDTYAARVAPKPTAAARTKDKLDTRISEAKDLEAEQREKLQAAVDLAMVDRFAKREAAREALSPKIAELQKSLAENEALLEKRYDAVMFLADAEGVSPDIKASIDTLLKEVKASRAQLEAMQNEANADLDTSTTVAAAHADTKVKFEFRVLERLQKKVADLVAKRKDVAPPEIAAAARAAEEQRKIADRADALARDNAAKADKEKRELEQRLATVQSAGIKGVERVVGGQREQVLTARQAKERKELEAADKNAQEAFSLVDKTEIKQNKRAIGPVTREETAAPSQFRAGTEESKAGASRTSTKQSLSEARGTKSRNVPITAKEMTEANIDSLRQKVSDAREEALKATQILSVAPASQNAEFLAKANAAEARLDDALQALQKAIAGTKTAAQLKREAAAQAKLDAVEKFQYSRGVNVDGQSKKDLYKALTAAMGESVTKRGKVTIFQNAKEANDTADFVEIIPDDAKGFVADGKVYLIADNIGKGHGLGVLLHELGAHVGFRNFFNASEYNALVKTVKNWAAKTDGSIESEIGQAAMRRVEEAKTPEDQVDDELLAYAVEEAIQRGATPAGIENGRAVNNWLKIIFKAFKNVLKKFGLNPDSLTAGDLVNLAHGAAQLELKGTWHGTRAEFDAFDFKYMGTGEGAQAFSWGTYTGDLTDTAEHYQTIGAAKDLPTWTELPEIQKWQDSQRPVFNGYTAKDFHRSLIADKESKFGGVSRELMPAVHMALREYESRMLGDSLTYDSPVEEFQNILEEMGKSRIRNLFPQRFLATRAGTPVVKAAATPETKAREAKLKAEIDALIASVDYRNFQAVSTEPMYRGVPWYALPEKVDPVTDVASTVMFEADKYAKNPDAPFKQRIAEAVVAVRKKEEYNKKLFKGSAESRFNKAYNKAVETLESLDKLDVSDITFNPPTAPPVPRPTGAMLRTVRTRPDVDYLLWDAPADKQSKVVEEAFARVLDKMTTSQTEKFWRILREEPTGKNLYSALSKALGPDGLNPDDRAASLALFAEGVAGNKFLDNRSRSRPVTNKSTYNYVDFGDLDTVSVVVGANIEPVGAAKGILFSKKPTYANPEMERLGRTTDKFVAKNKTWWDKIKANSTGLAFATQLVDRFAGFERLAKYMEPLKGSQMLMYLRQYDQRMHMVQQSIENGAPIRKEIVRADGRSEYIIESKEGANIKNVVTILKDAQPYVGNGEAVNRTFTMYLAALRAENKGLASLNFGEDITQAMLDEVMTAVNGNAALKKVFGQARDEYNAYNRDMIQFLASSGAISKATAQMLSSSNDYIPFYREQNGVAQLLIGGETPVKLGNIADQPHLKELIGGEQPILDFMTSSVQNTNMLVDMAMRNLATKNAVFELVGLNAAKIVGKTAGPDVVRFKEDGEDRYAVIDTETIKIGNKEFNTGVPAELLVKGMEGIPTQMPVLLRAMAVPSQLLRKAITLSPMYMAKQLFRDSLAAPILSGANFTPVFGALREINSATKGTLEQRGIVGSQYMTGSSEDISQILRNITEGKPGWMKALGALEAAGMEADALTRRAQYNSYISQGLSEMEATLLSLESMNFNKRGASPSIHAANALIPFFNAQIQGLNVMYQAMTGNLPFSDRLKIQSKLLQRGALMAGATLLYAAMMEDDEAYKNATPDQKYASWFVRIPGVSEAVRVPLPFEIGYIFKALPEALYNSMTTEHGGEEAVKAFKQILLSTIPGGSSYGIPQVLKPAIEAGLGKSFYTGRDILSAREKELLPEEQFRANTADISKALGKTLGISPVIFEQLVNGYTGTMGLAFLHAVSVGVPKSESPENAVKRLSEYPIVGGAFQPNDAGGIINSVYERFNEDIKVRNSVKRMLTEGRTAEAKDLLQRRGNEYLEAEMADQFKANMNKLTQATRAVQASSMNATEKRKQLDEIKKLEIAVATTYREAADKTTRQASRP